ncbi:MAG TPA: HDIG domain-containing metalloprotein [Coleofasciculaceae cyanobacterium]
MKASRILPSIDGDSTPQDEESAAEPADHSQPIAPEPPSDDCPDRAAVDDLCSEPGSHSPCSPRRWRIDWDWFRLDRGLQQAIADGGARVVREACHGLYCQTMGQPYTRRHRSTRQRIQIVLLGILSAIVLTVLLGQHWLNQPRYGIGSIAPQNIVAPYDVQVVDQITTRSRREVARNGIVPVLTIDQDANQQLTSELQRRLLRGDELRQVAGLLPYWPSSVLSNELQQLARSLNEPTWQQIVRTLGQEPSQRSPLNRSVPNRLNLTGLPDRPGSGRLNTPFNPSNLAQQSGAWAAAAIEFAPPPTIANHPLVVALSAYRDQAGNAALQQAIATIERARTRYATAQSIMQDFGRQDYTLDLFTLTEAQWQVSKAKTLEALEHVLIQGLAPGLPPELIEAIVELHVELVVPLEGRALAEKLLLGTIDRPTLMDDLERTRQLAEKAADSVPLSIVSRRTGEMIVRRGERIDAGQFALLDRYGLSYRDINWTAIVRLWVVVSLAILLFWQIERRVYHRLRQRDGFLLLLLASSTPLLLNIGATWPWASPTMLANLSAIGLLTGGFYGSLVGMSLVGLLAGLLPLGQLLSWPEAAIIAAGGLVAAAWAGRARSREDLALLGGGVAIAQGGLYLIFNLINSAAAESVWVAVLGSAALCGLAGLSWTIVAIGLSPYLEHLFDLVTPIRLAELANPNRPLLKRLAAEAPGTFQHTLFVASLAEAAARALGCNVELVRTGTLYHDIGKLHNPRAFIENQMGGTNLHDELDNPWLSTEIVRKHVSEGLVMARRARLPKAVQAFIPEHQGTMLIAYFYYQAKQQQEQRSAAIAQAENQGEAIDSSDLDSAQLACDLDHRPVLEQDFRYPGPIPQSRETGIVMLADSCEAALRSLENATYEGALTMVNRMLRARWQDDQLVCSGLTREDLRTIAEVFVAVWQQFNHKRIAYPKAALNAPNSPSAPSAPSDGTRAGNSEPSAAQS